MKKLLTILTLFLLISCTSEYAQEMKKTAKARSASERINASDENSRAMQKELDKKND